jgi:Ni/Co efflux regulator RcnB
MMSAKPVLATLLFALFAAPVTQAAAAGPFDLTDSINERLDRAVERAHAADSPAQKRRILSKAFRDMNHALERTKQIPGLSGDTHSALDDLQQDIEEQNDRLNGLGGFAPVPNADLDRFADNAQTNLLNNQSITIGLGTALLIVIIIILLA